MNRLNGLRGENVGGRAVKSESTLPLKMGEMTWVWEGPNPVCGIAECDSRQV